MKKFILLYFCLLTIATTSKAYEPKYSTAGFYELPNTGRNVYNMNIAWRFYKGDIQEAYKDTFDDSSWNVVTLPHGIELLPEEASGSINYQGIVWYRKHFKVEHNLEGKKIFLYFEGIMGKSKIWINGKLAKEYYGGYLPITIDITPYLHVGQKNIIAVCADNSNDSSFAPGKPQYGLDFTYFGGIYRDCWLVTHNNLYITDPNQEKEKGGGGLFVTYPTVTKEQATMALQLHLRNERKSQVRGNIVYELADMQGNKIAKCKASYKIPAHGTVYAHSEMKVNNPSLWSPESPALYWLSVLVKDEKGKIVDGYKQRIGLRKIEMKGMDGLWINGKPYEDKLIGGNRHQDFAIIGNALSNSLHWRDAYKLRNAGMKIIRSAHYPQDPAFIDACDELGLFIIDATPGWQFFNKDTVFVNRVYEDIRNMVRRDRNHPAILFYEPVLNETLYPEDFALQVKKCVDEEMKSNNAFSATDLSQNGINKSQYGVKDFPIIYTFPHIGASAARLDSSKVYFTREFGDNVDDWSANNSTSRVCRAWGEIPMLVQAEHYAYPKYPFTCIESFYRTSRSQLGGTLWHSFDHQRGCNTITFYGGIMDAFRQPKTSYYMFMSQRPATKNDALLVESGPMVYVANEMTPFSPNDVTVYSNCEEVRLTVFEGGKQYIWTRASSELKMPSPIITFKSAFDFMETKKLSRAKRQNEVYLLAEGLIDGKVVATHKRIPSRRSIKIRLRADNDGVPFIADGSDIVTIIAEVVDQDGTVKRLNNNIIHFSVEGEGVLLGDASIGVNPVRANWGSAPILLKSTTKPGKIKIKAHISGEGINAIEAGELEIESVASSIKHIFDDEELLSYYNTVNQVSTGTTKKEKSTVDPQINALQKNVVIKELRQMEEQQNNFGEKP